VDVSSLCHSSWDCKYHVVWIPKYRRKAMFMQLRKYLGEIFHELAKQKESRILEGHVAVDHVHMLISIPPKYAVAQSGLYQRQECDLYSEKFWRPAKEF
jgi:putative transposase